jgi:hypothetical protein
MKIDKKEVILGYGEFRGVKVSEDALPLLLRMDIDYAMEIIDYFSNRDVLTKQHVILYLNYKVKARIIRRVLKKVYKNRITKRKIIDALERSKYLIGKEYFV